MLTIEKPPSQTSTKITTMPDGSHVIQVTGYNAHWRLKRAIAAVADERQRIKNATAAREPGCWF